MAEGQCAKSVEAQPDSQEWGCEHYRRKARLVAPCCDRLYWCRFCHDATEVHSMDRFQVSEIQCCACDHRQAVGRACERCQTEFGEYFCSICRLYDALRDQFHCDACGLCRVGGREQGFHCHRCGGCWPKSQKGSHWCRPGAALDDCSVCLEDLHSSREPLHVAPCSHSVHQSCRQKMLQHGLFSCPLCNTSMLTMEPVWKKLDEEVQRTAMPSR